MTRLDTEAESVSATDNVMAFSHALNSTLADTRTDVASP